MSSQEERYLLNKWSHEYYRERENSSAHYNWDKNRASWYDLPKKEDQDETRLRDIQDTYMKMRTIESEPILASIRDPKLMDARGTCTMGEILEEEVEKREEEVEEEEFLFDPKELDI